MLDIDLNVAPTIDSNATTQILDSPEAKQGGDGGSSGMVTAGMVEKQQETETYGESKSDNILGNGGGSLQLLIEAARYVEENEDNKLSLKPCDSTRSKGKKMEVVCDDDVEEREDELNERVERAPPVVRSKRGRSQVLPNKYRDSVMEPLARLTRPDQPVPTKRRSR
ncbi:hypothetical protein LIER_03673 [Lithospermum erythrorhizon]|uniref:Uncharacterized protein n=1 Tax=Lithospermum erythrorhizon TaxID=34254 RepID=A0AAV3NTZ6_LITER